MKAVLIRRKITASTVTIVALLVPVVLGLAGCGARPVEWGALGSEGRRGETASRSTEPARQQQTPREVRGIHIEPQANQEVADLSSDDIVRIMRRVGFPDDMILELGTDMHDALLRSGAARVIDKKQVEALLRINGRYVYITSLSRGTFVYDPATGQFSGGAPSR
jgi:hypothetical protein